MSEADSGVSVGVGVGVGLGAFTVCVALLLVRLTQHRHQRKRNSLAPKRTSKSTHSSPEGLKTDTELIAPLLERVNRNLSNFDRHKPIILGIAGGSGSGKTTLARAICEALGKEHVTYITHDSYYKDLSDKTMEEREKWNFDHPDSLDTDLLVEHIRTLKRNESVNIPTYDYTTHTRAREVVTYPNSIILVEGILIFADQELQQLMDIKIFVDTEDDIRLIRRIERDVRERARDVDSVMRQYLGTVRPMHKEFVEPSKRCADIIVPVGINSVALGYG